MHLETFRVKNYRRLKNVHVKLEEDTTIFVGANNSGKTSATQVFQSFFGSSSERFSIYDFSADCWASFDRIGNGLAVAGESLPKITLDLWFRVQESDLHRVISILPSLDWKDTPVGVRMEYAPKDEKQLLSSFHDAYSKSSAYAAKRDTGVQFHPWPDNLTSYLKKRLSDEYTIRYFVLDFGDFDSDYNENPECTHSELGNASQSGASLINSLLRVDFMTAQRHLSDSGQGGRSEDLSKRFSRFYDRNLKKHDDDFEAVAALANSESLLNEHLALVFEDTLLNLNKLGYPGLTDPHLVIKSAFNPESILTKNASVHYSLPNPRGDGLNGSSLTLPDRYNGLGYKNLIYMVVELLDFHYRWAEAEGERPPLHLVVVEEPEAHLHAQLQQVFIKKIRKILPDELPVFTSQLVVTTHSPHIIYESSFKPIRYFRRSSLASNEHSSVVLNLSTFYATEEHCRDFLRQYMKLTHCDLFFADAAVLVEGNVERLLLPLMIEMSAPELQSCYLSILEIGGAFAHIFKNLVHFLGITTLVLTDLDSRIAKPKKSVAKSDEPSSARVGAKVESSDEDDDETQVAGKCMAHEQSAVTSNPTLLKWIPCIEAVETLLSLDDARKCSECTPEQPARVRVAYQINQQVTWNGESAIRAGRTFEEAFAFQNLKWSQELNQKHLHLRVVTNQTCDTATLAEVTQKIHARIIGASFNKTSFALGLMMAKTSEWQVPNYIVDGLNWLSKQLSSGAEKPTSTAPVEVVK